MATPNLITATSLVEKLLYSNQLTTTNDTTIYTVGAGKGVKIATGTVCNRHSAAVNVDIYVAPSGASLGAEHKIIATYSLAAGDTLSLNGILQGMMLGEGDFIAAKAATANVINITLTGAEAT
jgi:hypothetical protein